MMRVLITVLLFLVSAPSGWAATRAVGPAGDDVTGDGSAAAPYRTIMRALRDVPALVDEPWIINAAPGTYPEAVYLDHFAMPFGASIEQLALNVGSPLLSITIHGPGAIIAAPADLPCVTAMGVLLFLDGVTCQANGNNGLLVVQATAILDDVQIVASSPTRSGVYLDRATAFLGGS